MDKRFYIIFHTFDVTVWDIRSDKNEWYGRYFPLRYCCFDSLRNRIRFIHKKRCVKYVLTVSADSVVNVNIMLDAIQMKGRYHWWETDIQSYASKNPVLQRNRSKCVPLKTIQHWWRNLWCLLLHRISPLLCQSLLKQNSSEVRLLGGCRRRLCQPIRRWYRLTQDYRKQVLQWCPMKSLN